MSPLCPKHNECEEPEGAAMEVCSAGMGLNFGFPTIAFISAHTTCRVGLCLSTVTKFGLMHVHLQYKVQLRKWS